MAPTTSETEGASAVSCPEGCFANGAACDFDEVLKLGFFDDSAPGTRFGPHVAVNLM